MQNIYYFPPIPHKKKENIALILWTIINTQKLNNADCVNIVQF